jgi:hypothetical protein
MLQRVFGKAPRTLASEFVSSGFSNGSNRIFFIRESLENQAQKPKIGGAFRPSLDSYHLGKAANNVGSSKQRSHGQPPIPDIGRAKRVVANIF